jgi:hypothetical protein
MIMTSWSNLDGLLRRFKTNTLQIVILVNSSPLMKS